MTIQLLSTLKTLGNPHPNFSVSCVWGGVFLWVKHLILLWGFLEIPDEVSLSWCLYWRRLCWLWGSHSVLLQSSHRKAIIGISVWASQVARWVKNLLASAGDVRDAGSIPGLGRSPGGGHGNPLQSSCLENPMDKGAGKLQFAKSQAWLTEHACRGNI